MKNILPALLLTTTLGSGCPQARNFEDTPFKTPEEAATAVDAAKEAPRKASKEIQKILDAFREAVQFNGGQHRDEVTAEPIDEPVEAPDEKEIEEPKDGEVFQRNPLGNCPCGDIHFKGEK